MAKFKILVTIFIFVIVINTFVYAKDTMTNENRNEVLYIAGVIDNVENLDLPITRAELAKIVVKVSPYKDSGDNYIKIATEHKYMIRDIAGNFNENAIASYVDLIRASTTLLGYEDKDFIGNKVTARIAKFVELELCKNIDKDTTMLITKQDILNGIYNTLKERTKSGDKLYTKIWPDMTSDEDGELNASGIIKLNIDGPYVINRDYESEILHDDNTVVYINGKIYELSDLVNDISDYGYAVCYYDYNRDIIFSYTERSDVELTVACKKAYVYSINYSAKDFTTPETVDFDIYRYSLASEEAKFAFSHVGTIHNDDHVIIIYNKIDDIVRPSDKGGKEEGRIINGSIITAIKIS